MALKRESRHHQLVITSLAINVFHGDQSEPSHPRWRGIDVINPGVKSARP